MTIQKKYQRIPEAILANYTTFDVLTKRGILRLYGVDYKNAGVASYALVSTPVYSQDGIISTSGTAVSTLQFFGTFGDALTIDGLAVINSGAIAGLAAEYTCSQAIVIDIVDENGVVKTTASSSTEKTQTFGTNQSIGFVNVIPLNNVKVRKGDKIRVTKQNTTTNGSTSMTWFHDAKGRSVINGTDYGVENSIFSVDIPVKIDL